MDYEDRLDEQSKAVLETIPEEALDLSDIPRLRKTLDVLVDAMFANAPEVPGVDVENHWAPGPPGGPEVMVRVYTPSDLDGPVPGFYWIHGGGNGDRVRLHGGPGFEGDGSRDGLRGGVGGVQTGA